MRDELAPRLAHAAEYCEEQYLDLRRIMKMYEAGFCPTEVVVRASFFYKERNRLLLEREELMR